MLDVFRRSRQDDWRWQLHVSDDFDGISPAAGLLISPLTLLSAFNSSKTPSDHVGPNESRDGAGLQGVEGAEGEQGASDDGG